MPDRAAAPASRRSPPRTRARSPRSAPVRPSRLARRLADPPAAFGVVHELAERDGELLRLQPTRRDVHDDVVPEVEVGPGRRHDRRPSALHRARERAAHLAAVREAEVDRDVRGAHPRQEVLVRDVGVEAARVRRGRSRAPPARARTRDPPADEHDVHVLGQPGHRAEHDVDQLGRVLIAEDPDERPHPHRLERARGGPARDVRRRGRPRRARRRGAARRRPACGSRTRAGSARRTASARRSRARAGRRAR